MSIEAGEYGKAKKQRRHKKDAAGITRAGKTELKWRSDDVAIDNAIEKQCMTAIDNSYLLLIGKIERIVKESKSDKGQVEILHGMDSSCMLEFKRWVVRGRGDANDVLTVIEAPSSHHGHRHGKCKKLDDHSATVQGEKVKTLFTLATTLSDGKLKGASIYAIPHDLSPALLQKIADADKHFPKTQRKMRVPMHVYQKLT